MIAALASKASDQRGHSMVRAPDTRPKRGSSARAALASKASDQRGHSMVRALSASEDARERADDTHPKRGSSARAALASADAVVTRRLRRAERGMFILVVLVCWYGLGPGLPYESLRPNCDFRSFSRSSPPQAFAHSGNSLDMAPPGEKTTRPEYQPYLSCRVF